jgi:L-iditol 2-dehydrogenase
MAKYKGCGHIAICDIDERRVEFAVENGFAQAGMTVQRKPKPVNAEEEMSYAREFANEIANLSWPHGGKVGKPSVTFECTGVPSCVQGSIFVSRLMDAELMNNAKRVLQATNSGGKVMLVGMGTPNHLLPLSEAGAREIDLMPTWRYAHCYDESIRVMDMAAHGTFKPDIRTLITHRFSGLSSVPDAFAAALEPGNLKDNLLIKAVIDY